MAVSLPRQKVFMGMIIFSALVLLFNFYNTTSNQVPLDTSRRILRVSGHENGNYLLDPFGGRTFSDHGLDPVKGRAFYEHLFGPDGAQNFSETYGFDPVQGRMVYNHLMGLNDSHDKFNYSGNWLKPPPGVNFGEQMMNHSRHRYNQAHDIPTGPKPPSGGGRKQWKKWWNIIWQTTIVLLVVLKVFFLVKSIRARYRRRVQGGGGGGEVVQEVIEIMEQVITL